MGKITLVSQKVKDSFAGRTVNMPTLGEVKFEKDGSLIVDDDDKLDEFLKDTKPSFDFVDKSKKKEVKKTVEKETEPLFNEEELKGLSTEQLLELAATAGFGEEAAGWTDGKIRKELLKKVK